MDPVRRLLFLMLFASVLAAEPTHARSFAADRTLAPATARFIQRLAVTLRRTVQPAARPTDLAALRRALRVDQPARSQVERPHPAVIAFAFRLPPPNA